MHIVAKFQVNRACCQRRQVSAMGKWNTKKETERRKNRASTVTIGYQRLQHRHNKAADLHIDTKTVFVDVNTVAHNNNM